MLSIVAIVAGAAIGVSVSIYTSDKSVSKAFSSLINSAEGLVVHKG